MVGNRAPPYPNWQRKRTQNPSSVSSNLTGGTQTVEALMQVDAFSRFAGWPSHLPVPHLPTVSDKRSATAVKSESIGVDVQRHRRGRMPQHPLHHFGLAPDAIAKDTAVCRRACAVTRGNVLSASWQR